MKVGATRRRFLKTAASVAAASACGSANADAGEKPLFRFDDFDDYVEKSMPSWELPGLAVAVVRDGQVIHSRGYGIRTLGEPAKVDSQTVFPIASCTKAFTAAAIARLVDAKRVTWDAPVVDYLPDLGIDRRITVRMALSHRSGLPNTNMLWRRGDLSSEDIVARLKLVRPAAEPGGRFFYNNLMYLAAGKIVEAVSGRKWTDFVRDELFMPLKLHSTYADSTGIDKLPNLAAPHRTIDNKTRLTERYIPDAVAPAGTIHSNVDDMARWLIFHLEGVAQRKPGLLSPERLAELHAPPALAHPDESPKPGTPGANISRYGLGWFFTQHHEKTVIEHSGSNNGFIAWVAMVPAERFGFAILANQRMTGLPSALRSRLLDDLSGRPRYDWSEHVRLDYRNGYQRLLREAQERFEASRVAGTRASALPSALTGNYVNPLYGPLQINLEANELRLNFGTRFEGKISHWMHDQFRVVFESDSHDDWMLTLSTAGGSVKSLHIRESPWAPAWYDDADDLGEFVRA